MKRLGLFIAGLSLGMMGGAVTLMLVFPSGSRRADLGATEFPFALIGLCVGVALVSFASSRVGSARGKR